MWWGREGGWGGKVDGEGSWRCYYEPQGCNKRPQFESVGTFPCIFLATKVGVFFLREVGLHEVFLNLILSVVLHKYTQLTY